MVIDNATWRTGILAEVQRDVLHMQCQFGAFAVGHSVHDHQDIE